MEGSGLIVLILVVTPFLLIALSKFQSKKPEPEKPSDKDEIDKKTIKVKDGTTIKAEHPKVKRPDGTGKCLINLDGIHKYDVKSKDESEKKAAESSRRFLQKQIDKAEKVEVKPVRSEDDKEVAELYIDGKKYSEMFCEFREIYEVSSSPPPPPPKKEKPKPAEKAQCVAPVININPVQIPSSYLSPSSCHSSQNDKPNKDTQDGDKQDKD